MIVLLSLMVAATQVSQAQTFNVIYTFGYFFDGNNPNAGVTMDSAGNLYGTTLIGGPPGNPQGNCNGLSCGTVFKLTKSTSHAGWTKNILYTFQGGHDGAEPKARVIIGPDGNLYGTTSQGGVVPGVPPCTLGQYGDVPGCGIVFKLTRSGDHWTETVLYRFKGGADGAWPTGDLLFDRPGNIYGTTALGGLAGGCPHGGPGQGCGNVYKLTQSGDGWTQTVVYEFGNPPDGASPFGGVVFDTSGNLYGTTYTGGSTGFGTVFQLTPSGSGWTDKTIYTFQGFSDRKYPDGGVIFDASGNLYGTTTDGGGQGGGGVFKLTPSDGSWTLAATYDFDGNLGPAGSLIMDASANLYGTTVADGAYREGSVFRLTPSGDSWTYTSFHDFTNGSDGSLPWCSLISDANGNLYGTTLYGGSYGGTVFEITAR